MNSDVIARSCLTLHQGMQDAALKVYSSDLFYVYAFYSVLVVCPLLWIMRVYPSVLCGSSFLETVCLRVQSALRKISALGIGT